MAIRPKASVRRPGSAWSAPLAGLLATSLKDLIEEIVSRPSRAFPASGVGTAAVIDEVSTAALKDEIERPPLESAAG